jgi:hypothetical protein
MSFYTDVLEKDPRFTSTDTIKDMALLEPGTRAAMQKLIELAKAQGHDVRVTETYRSQARQEYVFSQGWSKLQKVGCHGYGIAADLGVFIGGKYMGDNKPYLFLPELCKEVGLISGIDWGNPNIPHNFVDSGHVQRIPVWRQKQVFSGSWYPPEHYNPYEDKINDGIAGVS